MFILFIIEFRLYICLKDKKTVKTLSGLLKYPNSYKILIILPYCKLSND